MLYASVNCRYTDMQMLMFIHETCACAKNYPSLYKISLPDHNKTRRRTVAWACLAVENARKFSAEGKPRAKGDPGTQRACLAVENARKFSAEGKPRAKGDPGTQTTSAEKDI
ncbi:hypothetical protein QE152_g5870 [Popillia japonica]|uniref:Uncharacterized protein n=1 Tax=Popillia japonica TaxID=7064 RepID=A0AAW1MHF8_POPJA